MLCSIGTARRRSGQYMLRMPHLMMKEVLSNDGMQYGTIRDVVEGKKKREVKSACVENLPIAGPWRLHRSADHDVKLLLSLYQTFCWTINLYRQQSLYSSATRPIWEKAHTAQSRQKRSDRPLNYGASSDHSAFHSQCRLWGSGQGMFGHHRTGRRLVTCGYHGWPFRTKHDLWRSCSDHDPATCRPAQGGTREGDFRLSHDDSRGTSR